LNIDKVVEIGVEYAGKLKAIGICTTEQLLEFGSSRTERMDLAASTGIDECLILEWVSLADLFRVPGIDEAYGSLLEKAGIETIKELRHRNPENLYKAIQEVNARERLAYQLPDFNQVDAWITAAKKLEPIVTS